MAVQIKIFTMSVDSPYTNYIDLEYIINKFMLKRDVIKVLQSECENIITITVVYNTSDRGE